MYISTRIRASVYYSYIATLILLCIVRSFSLLKDDDGTTQAREEAHQKR